MQVKDTVGVSSPGSVEVPPLQDVVVLVDSAGVALGVERVFSATVRDARDGGSGLIASRYVEIPLVGSDGEVSGILCHTGEPSDARGVVAPRRRKTVSAMADVAQFLVHDVNNLLAVIDSGLLLLEGQSDAAHRKAILGQMREAIARGALSGRLLDAEQPCPRPIDGFVSGTRLATIAGTLYWTLPPDIAVRIDIAPDLWAFNADPGELYFALLDVCRNSADAMPRGGTIFVTAHNVESSADAARGFVEIVVADDGDGVPERALPQVRLFLPRAHAAGRPGTVVGTEIAYTPSPNGGVFHVVSRATAMAAS
ncbi:ATP-binding protein [Bradyrhizobium sp. Arg68]|uniref:ATP-binding protein n=1 Tax=Bradyrhizobium ivorense TaxID=2511166 RepID=UPI001E341190|nr:ATP-binding protein [Bradyrhizobium ivorense]MCC8935501.1 ATP-binding protein [Bradyrhizobium ivorense]